MQVQKPGEWSMEQASLIVEQPAPAVRRNRPLGDAFRGTSLILGMLLLGAAALKGQQLTSEPATTAGFGSSRWLLLVVVGEVLLGLWVLSGWWARRARLVALACFGGFFAISLHRALAGETSCGCFGKLSVSPWVSATVDLLALAALVRWHPVSGAYSLRMRGARVGGAAVAACVVGVVATFGPSHLIGVGRLADDGDIRGDERVVALHPDEWVGKRLPLLKHVDIGEELARGNWTVVLYRRGCRACEEEISKYDQTALEGDWEIERLQVALVEVPDGTSGTREVRAPASCLRGCLSKARRWVVRTPALVWVKDGRVIKVATPTVEGQGPEG